MYLSQVRIKNFRGYGENPNREDKLYIFDDLDSPFTILNGFNGFGKTSFMEAIEWCLTDEIARLKGIEGIYDVRDLRKSNYLKYFHPYKKNTEDREIEVSLVFSNGVEIKRTSRSICHKTPNDSNYESVVQVINDKAVEESTTEDVTPEEVVLKLFVKGETSASRLLKTHILGQENINDFVRSNKPANRRSIFMQLLDLAELDDVHRETHSLKSSRDFFNKKKEISEKISSLETKLNGINTFFESRNYGSMENYLALLSQRSKALTESYDDAIEEIILDESILEISITTNTCVKYLINIEKKKNAVTEDIATWELSLSSLATIQELIASITMLDQGIDLHNRLEQAQVLQKTDYQGLLNKEKDTNEALVRLELEKSKTEEQLKKLADYKSLFTSLELQFNISKNTIERTLSQNIIAVNEQYKEFVNVFHEDFANANLATEVIGIDELAKLSFLQKTYESYSLDIINIKTKISAKEEELKNTSSLNESYSQLLSQIKQYIISNPNTAECPVCSNSDFTIGKYDNIVVRDSPTYQKLLDIIDHKVSAGDSIVRVLSEGITALRLSETTVANKIKNEVLLPISAIVTRWKETFERVRSSLELQIQKRLENTLSQIKEKQDLKKQQEVEKNRFEKCCKAIMQSETSVSVSPDMIASVFNSISKDLEKWNEDVLSRQIFSLSPTRDEVVEKLGALKQKEGVGDYYPDNLNLLTSKVNSYQRSIAYGKNLLMKMEDILKLTIPVECQEKFSDYNSLATQVADEKSKLSQVTNHETIIKNLNVNTTRIQGNIVEKKLKTHPIISWIYEAINPHPFYKKLIISSDNKGAHFKNETEEISLDHLFSSAQLNVLALSVFLGLGLTQEYSQLDHLFLDDPIQSMDDVNILAFIDILRGIMDSKYRNKRLIISTHDDNFAQLLAIKMRNKEFTQYSFVGYGVEGPIVKKTVNYI